jgi:hypothetical protein
MVASLSCLSLPSDALGGRGCDAADNAAVCAEVLADGGSVQDGWRFGIMQTIDDYDIALRCGVDVAASVFCREPRRTGHTGLDAAFAALATYLAERDGWTAPQWASDSTRVSPEPWCVAGDSWRELAARQTPAPFAARGVFITSGALARA